MIAKRIAKFRPLAFVLPALLFYLVFLVVPIAQTVQFSFFRWDGASPTMDFVGFANYAKQFRDDVFWRALAHNLFWIVSTIVMPVFAGLVLAVLLSSRAVARRMLYRVTFFLPYVISLVAVGVIWNWIYHPDFGIVNAALRSIGLGSLAQPWLGSETTVLPSLIVAGSWTYYGFCMVIFFAALQGIDKSYYEVARLEGANPVQTFFRITVPLLKNTVTLLVLNSLIGSFKVFDLIYLMTKGGPFHSSEVIATYMYAQAFRLNDVGYGAAISVTLAAIIGICSILYLRFSERND
ncbi:MAG TPA: sugar ABC transporter permease [Paenibacillus sp.]|nr:sugar ABC transporter permease [Paenibacillus sp.]